MNFTKKLLTRILVVVALATFTGAANAQNQTENGDKVLVAGEYSLKQSDINRLTELYEWMLAAEFTSEQRQKYQTLIVEEAQTNRRTAKALTEMLQSYQKSQSIEAAKRERLRLQILPDIIAAMEKEKTEVNQLLLSVYRNGQDKTANKILLADDAGNDDSNGRSGAAKLADLAGIWSTSSVSTERYKSLVTGELSDPSGSIIEYKISPNGEIKHVGYLSSTIYSCTTKLFISRTGRISINGSNITFDFAPGKRMYQTCSASASRNDTLPAERKTYPFRLERDKYGLQLCTVEDGKDFCIRKKSD